MAAYRMKCTKTTLIFWDFKESPPWPDILEAINNTGQPNPCIVDVDTGSDDRAVIIATKEQDYTDFDAKMLYNDWRDDGNSWIDLHE